MKNDRSAITMLFLNVMDIVKLRRTLNNKESQLSSDCRKYCVDCRIMAYLTNEYERTLEDSNYTMKTVDEILDCLKKIDDEPDNEPGSWAR